MLLVLGMGMLVEWAQATRWIESGADTVLLVTWILLLSSLLIWLNARSLNALNEELRRTLDARTSAERVLKRQASLFDQAYEGMVICRLDGPITLLNP